MRKIFTFSILFASFLVLLSVNVALAMGPMGNCNVFNGDQITCEATVGCTWQDACAGSVTCGTFSGNEGDCNTYGCFWNPTCSGAPYDCSDYSGYGSKCTDAGCSYDGENCTGTPNDCSYYNGYETGCTDAGCSYSPSCDDPSSRSCSEFNTDLFTCGITGCTAQDSCTGTYAVIINCGSVITSSITLTGDLNCSGDGLIINASDIVLDCGGNSISGSYNSTVDFNGILFGDTFSNVTIKNCVINGFSYGIDNYGVSGHVYSSTFINNTIFDVTHYGIITQDSDNLVQDNFFNHCGEAIFGGYVSNLRIIHNTINDTYDSHFGEPGNGIVVAFNGDYHIINNTITNSADNGLYIRASGEVNVTGNTITGSANAGIFLQNVSGGDFTNKHIWHNNIYDNSVGVNSAIWLSSDPLPIELSYNNSGNFWGSICPAFIAGVDSNNANVTDSYPYNASNSWDLGGIPANCTPLLCGTTITSSLKMVGNVANCAGNGLNITASDIVLDCDGYSISGGEEGTSGYGILVNASNVTVENCVVHGFSDSANDSSGIYIEAVNDITLLNNTFYGNYNGIRKWNGIGQSNYVVSNNVIQDGTGYGIYITNVNGLDLTGNRAYNLDLNGMALSGGSDVLISNNIVNNSYYAGIWSNGPYAPVIANNIISNSRDASFGDGLYVGGGVPFNATNNTIFRNAHYGLKIEGSSPGWLVWHNNIYNNSLNVYSEHAINLSLNGEGNYWGYVFCPTFTAGIDSNDAGVVDSYPYNESDGWNRGVTAGVCAAAPIILTCGDTVTASATLPSNLGPCAGNGLNIGANDVVLDCNGSSITGSWIANGINLASYNNTVIKNCILTQFDRGISIYNSNNNSLINDTVFMNSGGNFGLTIENSNFNRIESVILNDSWQTGMYLDYANNNTFIRNKIINNPNSYGVRIGSSNDNVFTDNLIDNNQYGIFMQMSNRNTFTGNAVSYSSQRGLFLFDTCSNNIFSNNNFTDSSYEGIYLGSDSNYGNTFTNSLSCYNSQAMVGLVQDINDLNGSNTFAGTTCDSSNPGGLCNFSCPIACGAAIYSYTVLTDDLGPCSGNGVTIGASDVHLDCNGHTIAGDNSGTDNFGVFAENVQNYTISNCRIINFSSSNEAGIYISNSEGTIADTNVSGDYAVYMTDLSNNIISGSNLIGLSSGAYFELSDGNYILNSTVVANYAVYLASSSGNEIRNSVINGGDSGIYFEYGLNNLVNSSTITGTHAAHLESSSDNYILSSNIIGSTDGIYADSAYNLRVLNSNISSAHYGIEAYDSSDILLVGNRIYNNSDAGIYIEGYDDVLTGAVVQNNNVSYNNYGISVIDCDSSQILNNTISWNNYSGIYMYSDKGSLSNHLISGNTIIYNVQAGAVDSGSSTGYSTPGGIEIDSEDNSIIENNDISYNNYTGISLYTSTSSNPYSIQILSNNMTGNAFGIDVIDGDDNTVDGNTLINNSYGGIGIYNGYGNNVITNNIIKGDGSFVIDADGIYSTVEGIYFNGNHISGYLYGAYMNGITDFTMDGEEYYGNDYSILLMDVGSSAVIVNSTIRDSCEGIYVNGSSIPVITDNTFSNNTCGAGLHTAGTSSTTLLNSNFYENGNWGIFGETMLGWVVTSTAECENSNINITNGYLVPYGGELSSTNCTIIIDGRLLNTAAGEQGSFSWPLDASSGYGILGGSDYGVEADVYTVDPFNGTIDIIFFTDNPSNSSVLLPFGKYVKLEHNNSINISSIILKIYYRDDEVNTSGLVESRLRLEYYNETSGAWERYDSPRGGVDTTNNYVWANVSHFSIFGIFGGSAPSGGTGGGGGGGAGGINLHWPVDKYGIRWRQMQIGDNLYFEINANYTHVLSLYSVTPGAVVFQLSSSYITVNNGEKVTLDVNGDGIMDIAISVMGINGDLVDVFFERLSQLPIEIVMPSNVTIVKNVTAPVKEEAKSPPKETLAQPNEEVKVPENKAEAKKTNWLPFIAGLAALLILIAIALRLATRKKD